MQSRYEVGARLALKRIWRDLRAGRNIDIYVATCVAVAAAAIGLLGIAINGQLLSSLTLGVLALLAIMMLNTRDKIDRLYDRESITRLTTLDTEEFERRWRREAKTSRKELIFIGVSLGRTVRSAQHIMGAMIERGGRVRVIVVQPGSDALRYAGARKILGSQPALDEADLQVAIGILLALRKRLGSRLEVRTIDHPVEFGIVACDLGTDEAAIYVEHHPYGLTVGRRLRFRVDASNPVWFDSYTGQIDAMWKASRPVGVGCASNLQRVLKRVVAAF